MRPRGGRASFEAGLALGAVVVTGAFAALFFPTGMAVRIKTRSPQTMVPKMEIGLIDTMCGLFSSQRGYRGEAMSFASVAASIIVDCSMQMCCGGYLGKHFGRTHAVEQEITERTEVFDRLD